MSSSPSERPISGQRREIWFSEIWKPIIVDASSSHRVAKDTRKKRRYWKTPASEALPCCSCSFPLRSRFQPPTLFCTFRTSSLFHSRVEVISSLPCQDFAKSCYRYFTTILQSKVQLVSLRLPCLRNDPRSAALLTAPSLSDMVVNIRNVLSSTSNCFRDFRLRSGWSCIKHIWSIPVKAILAKLLC